MRSDRAIFLDRDGTLVESRHYPSTPEDLKLYTEIAPQLRTLQEAGFQLIVITNQSGIARGYFSEADLERMHQHLSEVLRSAGVEITRYFHCPHHPDGVVPELAVRCDCRKPQPGMLLQARSELNIDLTRSWMIGDILNDVEAGNRAGCRTVLVDLETEVPPESPRRQPDFVAASTAHALRLILYIEGLGPEVDLDYLPARWRSSLVATGREL